MGLWGSKEEDRPPTADEVRLYAAILVSVKAYESVLDALVREQLHTETDKVRFVLQLRQEIRNLIGERHYQKLQTAVWTTNRKGGREDLQREP